MKLMKHIAIRKRCQLLTRRKRKRRVPNTKILALSGTYSNFTLLEFYHVSNTKIQSFEHTKSINHFKAAKHYSFLDYIGTGYGQAAT